MRKRTCTSYHIRSGGFSLIEIVLALGIISFALVSILGLLAGALSTSRDASDDRIAASMTTRLLSELRSSATFQNATTNYYFDVDGQLLTSEDGAVYEVEVEQVINTDYNDGSGTANLMNIIMNISPPAANQNSATTKTVHAFISR